jgi:general secretion pathway protein K
MKQRGIALLAILLVVSIVTVLAVGIAHSNMVRLGLTERRQESAQAWLIWQAGVEWSRDILREDGNRSQYDSPNEFWARGIRDYPAEGGKLSGIMIDQQGLFNLNNLAPNGVASEPNVAVFKRLLTGIGLDPALADTLTDWQDADHVVRTGGAEDQAYAVMQPPYRAADQAMKHLAELYSVKGYDAAVIDRLRPFVTVLPTATPINVNSASKELLVALLPDLEAGQADTLWNKLQSEPCADMNCLQRLLPSGVTSSGVGMGVTSQYFLLELSVTYGGTRADGEALLARIMGTMPSVVWRARGLSRRMDLKNPLGQAELTGGV